MNTQGILGGDFYSIKVRQLRGLKGLLRIKRDWDVWFGKFGQTVGGNLCLAGFRSFCRILGYNIACRQPTLHSSRVKWSV
jgi:hypothetical protein